MVPSYDSLTILFCFLGGTMEEYNMLEILRIKLLELRLQRKLMTMDKQFTKEDLKDMDEMIEQVQKEYAKTYANILEEQKKQKNEKTS